MSAANLLGLWLLSEHGPIEVPSTVLRFLPVVTLASFCYFAWAEGVQGGSALNGRVEEADYYLGQHSHFRPVDATQYRLSLGIEAVSISFALALLFREFAFHRLKRRR